ncbi:MAG: hypothetical protein DLM53_09195 [Candidatus Eremiobacter antarcticus]|nr:MAG: hypothetical protein DLM53_09195 [Candidatus Eremiobacter sp. RRmetagenome_bin22]
MGLVAAQSRFDLRARPLQKVDASLPMSAIVVLIVLQLIDGLFQVMPYPRKILVAPARPTGGHGERGGFGEGDSGYRDGGRHARGGR